MGIALVAAICLYPPQRYERYNYEGGKYTISRDRYIAKSSHSQNEWQPVVDYQRFLILFGVLVTCLGLSILVSQVDLNLKDFPGVRQFLAWRRRRVLETLISRMDAIQKSFEVVPAVHATETPPIPVDHFQLGLDYLKCNRREKAIQELYVLKASKNDQEAEQLQDLIIKSANKAMLKLVIGVAVVITICFALSFLSR